MRRFTRPAAGSVAIVTGASAGIGRTFARELAGRGHVVLAVARRADRLAELVAGFRAASGGGRIETLALDVVADGAAERIVETARKYGEIGWLVNNAGMSTFGRFEEANIEQERALVRLNCEAVVALTSCVVRDLVRSRRGIILNVASTTGMQPTPGWISYGASKAFVLSFSEGLFEELKGSGVVSTALAPGPVATEFFAANAPGSTRKRPPWELSAEACVRRALRGALAGKALIVPGFVTRLLAFGARFSPRASARWVSGKIGLRYVGLPPLPPRR